MEAAKPENEKRVYCYVGPSYKQAKNIVWRDPKMFKHYIPRDILAKDPNETELYCELFNHSIIQVRGADDPDSLRGSDYAGVVLDEWALIKPSVWEEIIQPVLRANGGWAWFLFTPKGRNHAFKYWRDSVKWKGWDKMFLNVNESKLITSDELANARSQTPEALYRQEYLCEFLEGAGTVFKGILGCLYGQLAEPQPGHRYVMGVDLARTEDFTVLICVDQGTNQVVAFDRFNEISWTLQKEKIAVMARKYNNAAVVVDASGVGDPIFEDLSRLGLNVEGFKFNSTSKTELVERLILAIEQRIVYFPNIPELVEELEAFTYELTPTGKFKYTAPDGQHDDCVIALGLALYGLHGNLYKTSGKAKSDYRQAYKELKRPAHAFSE